jgi:hypothetical protein
MRKLQVNTVVVINQELPHFGLCKGEIGQIVKLYKQQNVYDVYFFNRKETRRLGCNLVTRIAKKHLQTKPLLKSLKETGMLFAEYVPVKLRKWKKEELLKMGYIDEKENLTSFAEKELAETRSVFQIIEDAERNRVKPMYINTTMYDEKYGEKSKTVTKETVNKVRKMYE